MRGDLSGTALGRAVDDLQDLFDWRLQLRSEAGLDDDTDDYLCELNDDPARAGAILREIAVEINLRGGHILLKRAR